MKALLFISVLLVLKINTYATTIYASSFGWNSSDATSASQSAINSPADAIIIDKQAGDWIIGRWFEHNCYYSLRTADEYAWVYAENTNWWTGNNMPQGFA